MKDFEIKIGKYTGKKVSELLKLDTKYFIWFYNTLWEKKRMEEHCFCMEDLWKAAGHELNLLTEKPKPPSPLRNNNPGVTTEARRFFYHLSDTFLPESVPLSKVTQAMLDAEDDWIAENYEMIIEHK